MILYNLTINIEDELHDEWLEWLLNEHIPNVLATGMFESYRMFKVLNRFPEETGTTYSIQYMLKNMADYELYRTMYSPALQDETLERFGDRISKIVTFRTLLEEI
jgi:hypothetical protein